MTISRRGLAFAAVVLALTMSASAQGVPATPESLCTIPPEAAQDKVRKEFGAGFAVVETERFRLVSDCSLRYRKLIAGGLQQFYGLVHKRFFKKEMKRITVYLVDGAADFETFCRKRGHEDLAGSYGLYVPDERAVYTRRLMPDGTESGFGTMFHEAIHAMVHADFGGDPPSWFNEGFASLFEQGRVLKGVWAYGNPNPWREVDYKVAFESGQVIPLAKYFALTEREFRGPAEMLHYNTGRSICLWLLLRGENQLARYVDLVRQKKGGVAAIEGASGMKIAEIEKAWRAHVTSVHFGGACIQRARKASTEEALKILEEGAKLYPTYGMLRAEYAMRLARVTRPEDAEREATAALQDPKLPIPQAAWNVLMWRYKPINNEKYAESAKAIFELQPWLESIDEPALTGYANALAKAGKSTEAAAVEAELKRLLTENTR